MVTVRVTLSGEPVTGEGRDASYDVLVGRGLLKDLTTLLSRHAPAQRYVVITDDQIERTYARRAATDLSAPLLSFAAGEGRKTRETWADLTDRLLAHHVGRDACIVAVGGGVVGDVAGFVAATYLRGIPCVHVPTTLLAMIDASIGGKTGVNTPAGKNLVGAFHQPRLVVADIDTLDSLPAPQYAAGLAEAVKHGVIADADYFTFLERETDAVTARKGPPLERLVARSVEIKAGIVAADEREAGIRAALNFGHTVGHAVEATSGYSLLHGEAVAIGMAYEARLAEILGIGEPGIGERLTGVLGTYRLPVTRPSAASVDQLISKMRNDKKSRAGDLRFALPRAIGAMHGGVASGWTVAAPEGVVRELLAVKQ
ncbi:MAG TPA: 3-dehydroquinate synthase [Gemmatimonadales bacterium]|nr:3-dehydroquinate synthase [Gemmatimonadales bacterium]